MQCSKEALVRLFYNLSSSSFLLLLFLYSSSILLSKFLYLVGSYPLIQRSQNEYDYNMFSDEEEVEEDEEEEYGDERYNYRENCMENDHLVADIIHGGESLLFLSQYDNSFHGTIIDDDEEEESMMNPHEEEEEEEEEEDDDDDDDDGGGGDDQVTSDDQDQEYGSYSTEQLSAHDSSPCSGSEHHHGHDDHDDEIDSLDGYEEIITNDDPAPTPIPVDLQILADGHVDKQRVEPDFSRSTKSEESKKLLGHEKDHIGEETSSKKLLLVHEKDHVGEETLSKKLLVHEKDHIDEETFYGDSCTNGSTSKSSSEWRSSINCRDSGTDDPFSSSSRGSCLKWETYTVYQKYDEEMLFLHRVSAQKLQETESLRSIQACPRSISERIVHKFAAMNKKPSDIKHNPYYELEAAYVAQICLTWEALNWNYKNFERKRAARKDFDCPAGIAQQFQQFQVLLQRYNETEPYEKGRRPEVYARMRLVAPKLLMVPEYRDYEDDQKDEGFGSRISADSFLVIIEDGIQTFMNFLKADKEKPYQIIKAMLGWKRKGLVDPTIVQLMKKVNAKKKMKLKDLGRTHRYCMRKKKPKVEKMEILMSLIDLKVVSRVLRMIDLSEQQLHWCEEKMSKVKIFQGGLQRDSSPLFFPAH